MNCIAPFAKLGLLICFALISSYSAASPILQTNFFFDFEGIAAPVDFVFDIPEDSFPGLTLVGLRFSVVAGDFSNFNFPGTSPSDFLLHDSGSEGFSLLFDSPIDKFSARFAVATTTSADPGGTILLRFFRNDQLVSEQLKSVSGVGDFDSLIQVSALTGATRLVVDLSPPDPQFSAQVIALDDLSFSVVPEPSGAGLSTALATIILLARPRHSWRSSSAA